MALIILGKTRCPLCEAPITSDRNIVATTPFLEASHPLVRYADATMHYECFQRWLSREQFVAAYNERVGLNEMLPDGRLRESEFDAPNDDTQASSQALSRFEKMYGGYLIRYAPSPLPSGRFAAQAAVFRGSEGTEGVCVVRPHPREFDDEEAAATAGLTAAEAEIKTGTIEKSDW